MPLWLLFILLIVGLFAFGKLGLGDVFGSFGQGIGQLGVGVQTAISALMSPQITPSFVPEIGLRFVWPFSDTGGAYPTTPAVVSEQQRIQNLLYVTPQISPNLVSL